jgi:hypothetical protein
MNPTEAIQALLAARWTESRIAAQAKTSQANINRIKGGRMPGYDLGLRLVAMGRRAEASTRRKQGKPS